MSTHKRLLIVANQPSDNTRLLASAVARGASDERVEGIEVILRDPLSAGPEEVMSCNGIIIGTTENFGYMSGLIKDFLERIYYPCLEKSEGLPYALYIRAGNDGTGAQSAVERIVTGLRWSAIQPCLTLKGDYQPSFETDCEELGLLMAAGLEAGVF